MVIAFFALFVIAFYLFVVLVLNVVFVGHFALFGLVCLGIAVRRVGGVLWVV